MLTLLLSALCSPALGAVALPGGVPIMPRGQAVGESGTAAPGDPIIPQGQAVGELGTAAAPYDYKAVVKLDKDAVQDSRRMEKVSRELFEAYLAREVRPILRGLARIGFERALPWNVKFAQERFDNLEFSFSKERLFPGGATFVSRARTRYKGRTVEFLRFMRGAGAATAVRVDDALVKDKDGRPYLWYNGDEEAFARWFDRAFTPAEK